MIQHQAKTMARDLGVEGFAGSNGWLQDFLKRKKLQNIKLHGEGASAHAGGTAGIERARADVPKLLGDLSKHGNTIDDVYNCDETGMLYWMEHSRAYILDHEVKRDVRGARAAKERITVLCC